MTLPPHAGTFVILNIIRLVSIIALLLVFTSNLVILVEDINAVNRFVLARNAESNNNNSTMISSVEGILDSTRFTLQNMNYIKGSTVPNQPTGPVGSLLNRIFITFQVMVLILSELGNPFRLLDGFFTVLGSDFGVGALGLFEMLIGVAFLSHRVNNPLTLGSALLLFSVGWINILVGVIFRESSKLKRSLTSWKEHSKATAVPSKSSRPPSFVSELYTGGSHGSKETFDKDESEGYGFSSQWKTSTVSISKHNASFLA